MGLGSLHHAFGGGVGGVSGHHLDSRESTAELDKLDLDDLHSVQEELKRKMQATN